MVEEWFAFLTVMTHRIMLTIVTYAAADTSRRLVDRWVKMTPG